MVKQCVLKFGGGVMEIMSALEALPYLSMARRSNGLAVMARTEHVQCVEDVLSEKGRPHMAQVDFVSVPMLLLPGEVLWDNEGVEHIAYAGAVSDDNVD